MQHRKSRSRWPQYPRAPSLCWPTNVCLPRTVDGYFYTDDVGLSSWLCWFCLDSPCFPQSQRYSCTSFCWVLVSVFVLPLCLAVLLWSADGVNDNAGEGEGW